MQTAEILEQKEKNHAKHENLYIKRVFEKKIFLKSFSSKHIEKQRKNEKTRAL
jgi:hypothetical protein